MMRVFLLFLHLSNSHPNFLKLCFGKGDGRLGSDIDGGK